MKNQLTKRLKRTHELLIDVLDHIEEKHLSSKLKDLPSNTVGQQFWCIAGARISYTKAAKAGKWQGFECPLTGEQIRSCHELKKSLNSSFSNLAGFLDSSEPLTEVQKEILLDLLEHEVQHHGQLIRYMYGFKIGVPQSWKDRYALD